MSSPHGTPVRIGLIGAGRWGRVYIRNLRSLPGLRLSRLASTNPESSHLAGPECRVTADWREVATAEDLDGVIIATPPALHAEMAETAARAGRPVMVEKPLTLNVEEALRLSETVEQTGAPVLVNHIQIFHPGYRRLKEEARSLGSLRFIRSEGGAWGPFRPETPAMWDYGPHDISLCLDLLREYPAAIVPDREEVRETPEGPGEMLSLRLHFQGGIHAFLRFGNLMAEKRRRMCAYFDGGALLLDDRAPRKLTLHEWTPDSTGTPPSLSPEQGREIPIPETLPLTCALETFVAGIRGERREGLGLALGVQVVRVLSECQALLASRS